MLDRSAGEKAQANAAPEPKLELEATLTHHFSRTQSEAASHTFGGSKQDRDLAFAVALLQAGIVTERQLAKLASNWTAFGVTTLAEQAVADQLLSEQQRQDVEKSAGLKLRNAIRNMASNGASTDSSRERWLTSRIDPGGRVARMLGIADAGMLSGDEVEDRSLGARYTLLRKLGRGGLGVVWLAKDENLQRYVAVKEISREIAPDDVALEHFRREAEITGRLEHPSIVPVYQFGRDERTGRAFYAMRFLGRRTLQDAITEYHERSFANGRQDTMMQHRLLTAFVSVCHAVGHAHAMHIIHRDLKPTNIALDEFGQVTLLDWGLAKVNEQTGMYDVGGRAEAGDLHSLGSTAINRVIGTPLYMAPEQASGKLENVDELTDIFGLGGILYAILTGVGPHQSTVDAIQSKLAAPEVLSRIVADSITPPEKLKPQTPPELNAICMKALSRKPYLRYNSATELAEEVERYLAGAQVHAYEAPLKRRVTRWMSNHPTLAQALLLMASLLLVAAIAIAFTARRGRQQLDEARYAAFIESARDLEVNLQFEAQELERDLHFLTELPLMRAITLSQNQLKAESNVEPGGDTAQDSTQGSRATGKNESDATRELSGFREQSKSLASYAALQSPDEWLDRQGELFDGFLGANPAYLMLATCLVEDDGSFRELVRAERVNAGMPAHRVPRKQLMSVDANGSNGQQLIQSLRPGAVVLATRDQLADSIPTHSQSALILTGIAAIYDADGEIFGLNIIQLDLRERLRSLLTAVAPENVNLCITDATGRILMNFQSGRFVEPGSDANILQQFPQLSGMLATEESGVVEYGDGKSHYAKLGQLGSGASRASFGIVAHTLTSSD